MQRQFGRPAITEVEVGYVISASSAFFSKICTKNQDFQDIFNEMQKKTGQIKDIQAWGILKGTKIKMSFDDPDSFADFMTMMNVMKPANIQPIHQLW